MAVTFRGSLATRYMMPMANSECFVLEVSPRARCKVKILRLVMQFDTLAFSTGTGRIMPLIKARKGIATASGGVIMKAVVPWDTALAAQDSGVIIRLDPGYVGTESSDIVVTGTLKTIGQEFSARLTTGAEQWISYDADLADPFAGGEIILSPGELLAVQWGESSTPVSGTGFLQLAWEEDQTDAGYTVGGAVTLNSSPVSGAKVLLVTDTDRDLLAPELEVLTTGAPGTWSKVLASGVKASVFVQARSGETLYTDEGKPYIAKP